MSTNETSYGYRNVAHDMRLYSWTWRILDLLVSGFALIATAPLFAFVSLLILIDSGMPIFFSQMRLGQGRRPFRIYKFRKFHRDVGRHGCGVTLSGDQRMNRLGVFLERSKLDEIPQLWNIFKGEMSFVGPRPESFDFADCFCGPYGSVLDHKPGIFGPNQFYFRNEGSLYPQGCDPETFYREVLFPLKANIDIAYFPNRTFARDFGWILCCLLAVFGSRVFRSHRFDSMLRNWIDVVDDNRNPEDIAIQQPARD